MNTAKVCVFLKTANFARMKILIIAVGKTVSGYLQAGENEYSNRLKHYADFEYTIIPSLKNSKSLNEEQQKSEEGKLILGKIVAGDFCVLLDENGQLNSSEQFAKFIDSKAQTSVKRLVFVIGGPYGFSKPVYDRSDYKLSLSPMTFSHQMVRMIFLEQLYRALTILKNEPYHHK